VADLILSPRAEADLDDIWATIAITNEPAADRLFHRIMKKLRLAANNPLMGSPRPELSKTARVLIEGRYLAIYEPLPNGVLIVAVVHGMRDPETWL
jgi:toxin ParE1/3/4